MRDAMRDPLAGTRRSSFFSVTVASPTCTRFVDNACGITHRKTDTRTFVTIPEELVQDVVEERCYRCIERGHRLSECSGVDNTGRCFRCGLGGHKACSNAPKCLSCG
uniref:CCHC-type domain-containing protein n=1 Tax=Anopheles epiroticus TaxID=199890 RepID=A0A182PXA6_9DIPT